MLKTYLLRIRSEKGERAARQLLTNAGIESVARSTTRPAGSAWATAKRALKAIAEILGPEALRKRGEWTSSPEALGTLVRMLRVAERPIDAYRYLASNSREVTRIGTWELEEPGKKDGGAEPAKKVEPLAVKMTYRLREDADESVDRNDKEGEELLCAARKGELASLPTIWGLPDATVTHEACIAKGAEACVYGVTWEGTKQRTAPSRGLPRRPSRWGA